jgi:hypothetical protein
LQSERKKLSTMHRLILREAQWQSYRSAHGPVD